MDKVKDKIFLKRLIKKESYLSYKKLDNDYSTHL